MFGRNDYKRRTRSQSSSRHVSSSEDESSEVSGLFAHLLLDDEDTFFEEHENDVGEQKIISRRSSKTISDGSFSSALHHESLESQSERDFMKYLVSLPEESSAVVQQASKSNNKVGLDHLDNLCKLLEQLGDLKEKNQKLEQRVEYLEGLRMLHDMHRKISSVKSIADGNKSPNAKEPQQISRTIYRKKKQPNVKSKYKGRTREERNKGRNRSKSVGNEEMADGVPLVHGKGKSSKWTKMKEALGIEKTEVDPSLLDPDDGRVKKSLTSDAIYGETRQRKVGASYSQVDEHTRAILPPGYSNSDDDEDSSIPSEDTELKILEEIDRLSVSPILQANREASALDKSKSLPREGQLLEAPQQLYYRQTSASPCSTATSETPCQLSTSKYTSKTGVLKLEDKDNRKHRSPWNKVRNIIHTRKDSLKYKKCVKKKGGNLEHIDVDPSSGISVEISRVSEDESPQLESMSVDEDFRKLSVQSEPGMRRGSSTESNWQDHSGDSGVFVHSKSWKGPRTSTGAAKQVDKKKSMVLDLVPQYLNPCDGVEVLQRSNSYSESKEKDEELSDEDLENSLTTLKDDKEAGYLDSSENLPDVDCKGIENKRFSILSLGTGPTLTVQELQRNLSDDFSKKMDAWEKLKAKDGATGKGTPTSDNKQEQIYSKFKTPKKDKSPKPRADQVDKNMKQKHREKALNWMEKELLKIDKEKQRLIKEKQKFQERQERLEKLKGSMLQPQKKENEDILIKTSAGEFRFEGISKNFTKKLYEWEEKKGVTPNTSTIALLSSSTKDCPIAAERNVLCQQPITKSKSETSLRSSEGSSLFSMESARPDDLHNLSSSEPQIFVSSPQDEPFVNVASFSPEQVTKLIDGDENNSSTNSCKRIAASDLPPDVTKIDFDWCEARAKVQQDDSCSGLWDENMTLLDKLKVKENECKLLQTRLDDLDTKLDEMSSEHSQEVESYKRKLSETYETLFEKSRDIPTSALDLAKQLKSKVEQLDENLQLLKQERQSIQSTFESHRKEQNILAEDLVTKMKALHQINTSGNGGKKSAAETTEISKINELSFQLVNQAKDLEGCMLERNQLIDKLRWHVLDGCVSNLKLRSEINEIQNGGSVKKKNRKEHYKTWSPTRLPFPTPDLLSDTGYLGNDSEELSTITFRGEFSSLPSQISAKIHELHIELKKFQMTSAKNSRRRIKNGPNKKVENEKMDGGSKSLLKSEGGPVRRRIERQTRVSKASSPPSSPLPSSPLPSLSSECIGHKEFSPIDDNAYIANKQSTSISSGPLPKKGASKDPTSAVGDGTKSSTRKTSRDESLGSGSSRDITEPITQSKKLIELLEVSKSESGIPVYTIPAPKKKKVLPEISCTFRLISKPMMGCVEEIAQSGVFANPSKPWKGIKTPKSPKYPAIKEPRLNVRELAAQYDRKVTEMKSPKSERKVVDEIRLNQVVCPLSPSSRARMAKLRKIKEEFLTQQPESSSVGSLESEAKFKVEDQEDSYSMSSASEVMMFRTGENCQENRRRSRKLDGGSPVRSPLGPPEEKLRATKTTKDTVSECVPAPKTSFFNNIRLRRNKKKKELANDVAEGAKEGMKAVTALCRQSLYVDVANKELGIGHVYPAPRSCPASPEMKYKGGSGSISQKLATHSKPNWLHRLKPK